MSDNLFDGLLGGLGKDNGLLILIAILFLFGGGGDLLGGLGLGNLGGAAGPAPGPGGRPPGGS